MEASMDIVTHVISFLAGLGAGWTLKVVMNSRSASSSQIGNKVGGDMAGGDINKR
jgi:hypothetical protein